MLQDIRLVVAVTYSLWKLERSI